jgi:hypothetical protein
VAAVPIASETKYNFFYHLNVSIMCNIFFPGNFATAFVHRLLSLGIFYPSDDLRRCAGTFYDYWLFLDSSVRMTAIPYLERACARDRSIRRERNTHRTLPTRFVIPYSHSEKLPSNWHFITKKADQLKVKLWNTP